MPLRIAYAGDRDIGVWVLDHLLARGCVPAALLVSGEERASHARELEARLPHLAGQVFRGAEFRTPEGLEALGALELDYIVAVHFPYLFPPDALRLPRVGVLNLHPAFLPYNRGWHTASWAILEGTPAGATLHFMDEGVDSGDIVHQREQVVSPADTADTLYQQLKRLELEVFKEGWARIEAGPVPRESQQPGGGARRRRGGRRGGGREPPAGRAVAGRGAADRSGRAGAGAGPASPAPGPHHQYAGRGCVRRARRGAVQRQDHPASGALSGLPRRGPPARMSLTVKFSDRFVAERRYVFEVLLREFLGLVYTVQIDPAVDAYLIELPNGRRLRIRDAFFGTLPDSTAYISSEYLPRPVRTAPGLAFAPEHDAVVLYGEGSVVEELGDLACGVDIVATLFFMLTRWEEAVDDPPLDQHGRWPATASVAYQHSFLDRPIVNEYVEAVWSMLTHLGLAQARRPRHFEIVPTHDIDVIYHSRARTLAYAAIKARSAGALAAGARGFFSRHNPFDTFGWLMDLSESVGVRSRFNLIGGGTSRRYDLG